MKGAIPRGVLAGALVLPALFSAVAPAASPPKINDAAEGQKLAAELRNAVPTEEITFNGVLRISAPNMEPREVPIQSKVVIKSGSWSSVYTAKPRPGEVETLAVHHLPGKRNEYEWSRNGVVRKMDGAQATNSFAGSDFALMDLGLEFFHWPGQLLVTREMRKGAGCDVLESRPGPAALYSRVLSWIAQESRAQGQPGVIMAEGYDGNGRLLKEFEVSGFKKGQVTKMELRNRQTKTSTRLVFEFDKE